MRSLIWILMAVSCASAAMMAVDLGSQFFKVAIVKPRAGLEIALNEQSKRKTPTAVAFGDDAERLFGDAASTYSTKYPERAILNARALLGTCGENETDTKCKRDTARVTQNGKDVNYAPEVVMAMVLSQAKKFAIQSVDSGSAELIQDCAITVPSWFGVVERAALLDAAKLAGLGNVNLMRTNTAVALKLLFDAKEESFNQTILVYDVGASSTSASVFKISKFTKLKEEHLVVDALAHAWDTELSGDALDTILVNYAAEKFDEQEGSKDNSVKAVPRVLSRLRKEVRKLREVLSANTEAIFSVGSLHNDKDFRMKMLRTEFEELAAGLFERALVPVKKALEIAGVKAADLDAVIPFGGVSRIPKINSILLEGLERESLNKSINSDEGAAFGALWYIAGLNSLVKGRKVDIIEHLDTSMTVGVGRDNSSTKADAQMTPIFSGGSRLPLKKTINFKRKGDFNVTVHDEQPEAPLLAAFGIGKVENVLKKLANTTIPSTPKVSITFNLDRMGMLEITKAEATLEETLLVERPAANQTATTSPTDKAAKQSPSEKEEAPADGKKKATEKVPQTTVHRVQLSKALLRDRDSLAARRMSAVEYSTARQTLNKLDDADRKRRERVDKMNSLESSIFQLRDQLYEEKLEEVSTEDEREACRTALMEAEDWVLDTQNATAKDYMDKESELRSMVGRLFHRMTEIEARPKAVEGLQKIIDLATLTANSLTQIHEERNSTDLPKIQAFAAEIEENAKFLNESVAAQEGKTPFDDPAFNSTDLNLRAQALTKRLQKVTKIPTPAIPTEEPQEPEETEAAEEVEEVEEAEQPEQPEEAAVEGDDPAPDEAAEESDEDGDKTEL